MNNYSKFFSFSNMKSVANGVLLGVPDALSLTSGTAGLMPLKSP